MNLAADKASLHTVYLGLGSNEGDREGSLRRALAAVGRLPGTVVEAVSSIVESIPEGQWASAAPGKFLNCCCRAGTALPPLDLLHSLKDIEKALGRECEGIRTDAGGGRLYSDRTIDIDILLYDNIRIDLPELTIPHPRMWERPFVTGPLQEILKI